MNWIADENIESIIVERLRASGHEVVYVAETFPETDDEQAFALAEGRKSLLLTEDKAFAAVCFRRRARLAGVVLLRLPGSSPAEKAARLMEVSGAGYSAPTPSAAPVSTRAR